MSTACLLPDVVKEACLRGRLVRGYRGDWTGKVSVAVQATVAAAQVPVHQLYFNEECGTSTLVLSVCSPAGEIQLIKQMWRKFGRLQVTYKWKVASSNSVYLFTWEKLPPVKEPVIYRAYPYPEWIHNYTPQIQQQNS